MQSRSNVMAERLPEGPILGFYENVPHYLSALSRMYTCFGQPFLKQLYIYNRDYICVRVFGDNVFTRRKSLQGSVASYAKDWHGILKPHFKWFFTFIHGYKQFASLPFCHS